MQPELRRYIQHISLSPDSINNDDVGAIYLFESWISVNLFCPVLTPAFSFSHMELVDVTLPQAVAPLMKYLQDTMVILTDNLVKENLTR